MWAEIQQLPIDFQDKFLKRLGENPQQNLRELADTIKSQYHDLLNPFDDPAANDAFGQARSISPEAEEEFSQVYGILGKNVDPVDILSKIENKFGPTQKTKDKEALERQVEQDRLAAAKKLQVEASRKRTLYKERCRANQESKRVQERNYVRELAWKFFALIVLIYFSFLCLSALYYW